MSEENITEETAAPAEVPDETEALRGEIERLRGEVSRLGQIQTLTRETLIEFGDLFPDVPVSSLPGTVWEAVEAGIPLPAAYALHEKREARRAARAEAANRKSSDASWRGIGTTASDGFLTPGEVRSMSQKEVHHNYKRILESMKHWK